MGFKFSLLSLEKTKDYEEKKYSSEKKEMKNKTKKQINQRNKFGKAVQYCHRTTKGKKSFGQCMRKRLKKK